MLENTCYNSIKSIDVKSYYLLLYYRVGEKPGLQRPIADFYFELGFSIAFLERNKIAMRQSKKGRDRKISNGTLQGFSPTLYREDPCFKILI